MSTSIEKVPLFKDLNPAELDAVKSCLRERSFQRGEALFLEGAGCERVFFVKSGQIKLYRISSSGREQILETLGPGDTCACHSGEASWPCSSTAEAMKPSVVWFLSRENYVRLIDSQPKLSRALNRLFAGRLRCLNTLVEEVSLKDSRKRLVRLLLDLLKAAPSDKNAVQMTSTREEIAQQIGAARETVARQLSYLKRKKLIAVEGRKVQILDRPGLESLLRA